MISELLILIYTMFIIMYVLPKRMENQYRIDKDGRTVFYPYSYKQGYILDDPSLIKQSSKMVWRNVAKTLFKDCETTDIPLSKETVKQNGARNSTWWELWIVFIGSTIIALNFLFMKLYLIAIVCFALTYPHLDNLCLKFKLQDKEKNGNINS